MNIFQESVDPVTKKPNWSMRRTIAAFFAVCTPAMFVLAFSYVKEIGWLVFLPGGLFLLTIIFLLFFTTWTDVSSVIQAVKNLVKKE